MKKTQVRFIAPIGSEDFKRTSSMLSNHALRCMGYDSKTITQVEDTKDSQLLTHLYRMGKIKTV